MIDPFLKQQIDQVVARFEFSRNIAVRSRTILELARAMMNVPPVPAFLRSLSEIKREQRKLTHEAGLRGAKLIEISLKELQDKVGDADFARQKARLLGDLRYLNPYLPLVVRNAERSIHQVQPSTSTSEQHEGGSRRPREAGEG